MSQDSVITPSYDRLDTPQGGNSSAPAVPAPAPVSAASEPVPAAQSEEHPRVDVPFTPAQQKVFDEAIRRAMGKAGSEARRELADARARLAEAEAQRDRAQAAAAPDATPDEKLLVELDAEKRRNAELTQTLRSREREAAIRAAAKQNNFVDEGDALRLVDIPDDADAATIQKAVSDFAANPTKFHLIRGTTKSGSGSGPSTGYPTTPTYTAEMLFGKGSNSALANKIGIQRPDLYKNLKAEAKRKGLVA
jgi:hypothetical protein